jgi:hypothetical protein
MADETPFGRYTYPGRDDIWVQFKSGPYRMRTKREWDGLRDDKLVFPFLIKYIEAWSVVDVDGKAVDMPELPEPGKPMDLGWMDDLDVSVPMFLVTSFSRLIGLDATRPPKV